MFAVSGKYNKSVSVEANKVTVLSLNTPPTPAISFEIDSALEYSCLEFSPFQPIFALASEASVAVYDASNGNLMFTIPQTNTSSVAFTSNNTLYTANQVDGTVVETQLDSSLKQLGSFIGDKKGVNSICVAGQYVAAAKNKIYIFDQANEYKCVSKFVGHDSPVVAMRFLENDYELVSCNGKEIFVWPSASKTRKSVAPLYQLKLESRDVSQLYVGLPLLKSNLASVLAVWPGGEARVWQLPQTATSTVEDSVVPAACNLTGVFAADFCERSTNLLCLPSSACEELVTVALTTQKKKKTVIIKDVDVLEAASAAKPAAAATQAAEGEKAIPGRVARVDHSAAAPKRMRKDSQAEEEKDDDRPLLSRLADFSSRLSVESPAALSIPVTTLSVTLEQALQTEEREKIEAVLQNMDLIQATIAKLNVNKLASLLKELQTRFACASSPARYEQLLQWLNSILELHSDFLAHSQECKQVLGEIYKVNESRVLSFAPLFRLKGKLDFTLARSSKQQQHVAFVAAAGPLVTVDCLDDGEE